MAPNRYLPNSRSAATVRTLDQAVGGRTVTNPLTSQTQRLTDSMADPVEMGLAHGVTGPGPHAQLHHVRQPRRRGRPTRLRYAVCRKRVDHGGVSPDVNTTWLGLVGPGVRHLGQTSSIWSNETDIRPTMMRRTAAPCSGPWTSGPCRTPPARPAPC